MGITHVTVSVTNLRKDKPPYEAEFLVDLRAIDCLAPASCLKAAGVEIEGRDVYELANGDVVEYPFGFARISFMGRETVAQIIFGPEDCDPILGTVALENTGIGVDPVSRNPKRMAANPFEVKPHGRPRATQAASDLGYGPAHRVLDIGAKLEDGKLIDVAKLEGGTAPRQFGDYNLKIHLAHLPKGAELWA